MFSQQLGSPLDNKNKINELTCTKMDETLMNSLHSVRMCILGYMEQNYLIYDQLCRKHITSVFGHTRITEVGMVTFSRCIYMLVTVAANLSILLTKLPLKLITRKIPICL